MKLLGFTLFLVFNFLSMNAYSQLQSVWEEVDVRYYYPQEQGLRDLSFSIRREGLSDYVKKSFHLNKVKDIYVQVEFIFPDRVKMQVYGIPDGFKELRQTIKGMVSPFLQYVLPAKFSERYQIYQFKKIPRKGGYVLKGSDPKFQSAIPEFEMSFDNGNILTKTAAMTPQGPNQTDYRYSKKRWSDSKFVLDNIKSVTKTKITHISSETDIVYEKFGVVGLPIKVSITNKTELTDEAKKLEQFKNQKHSWSEGTTVTFSHYEVNRDRAKKKLYQNNKTVQ